MINLQEYIDKKMDEMDYEFRISHEHMTRESDIVRDFLDEVFNETPGKDFERYALTDLEDLAHTFGAEQYRDIAYGALEYWLTSPDHDGAHHFEQVIKNGLVRTDSNFDFYTTIQAAQIHEVEGAVQFAHESELVTPVIAAKYMQNQGYEKANEDLLDKMGELIDASDLTRDSVEKALRDAKEELELSDKEVGEKAKDEKKKDRGIER